MYTGSALDGLTQIGFNDDAENGNQSRVSFIPTQSATYYIAVDGYDGETGNVTLNFDASEYTEVSVSGVVKLPNAETAPVGGLDIVVTLSDQFRGFLEDVSVTIAAGTNEILYSQAIDVLASSQVIVGYNCFDCSDYVATGYYNTTESVFDADLATPLTGTEAHTDIDLTLIVSDPISGRIALPGNDLAPLGGTLIYVLVGDLVSNSTAGLTSVFIGEGMSFYDYRLTIPKVEGSTLALAYFCLAGCDQYEPFGFYSDNGTTIDLEQATLLDSNMPHINKNITLVRLDDELCVVLKASNGNVTNICL